MLLVMETDCPAKQLSLFKQRANFVLVVLCNLNFQMIRKEEFAYLL
jgi:hypothetical protein